uniref:Uncharacterized protein n=1 Tax=Anguilla anguilla TaxID=7936 RepID=A0A0E9RZM5_ANGAN
MEPVSVSAFSPSAVRGAQLSFFFF